MLKSNENRKDSCLFDEDQICDEKTKENLPDLNNSNFQVKLSIKFNPKVVYQKCPQIKKVGQKSNLTYKFVKHETKLIKKILEGHGFEQIHSTDSAFNLMWTAGPIRPDTFKSLYPFQRVNHFPKSYELTRKDRLYKNIEKIQQEKGFKHFDFVPTTFVLPNQFEQFQTTFEKEKRIWIVKPIASSQGRGIFLINNVDDVPRDENIVVSRYIDNPLLIDGYKFDIRLYVAVTSYDPLIIYLYQEGLARFATIKYDRNPSNLSNCFIHLTNYSLNKRNDRYIRCDDPEIEDFGNKWTMSAMLRLLKSEGKDTFSLMMSIEDLIIKTFISVQSQISNACQIFVPNKSNCFEVYGFDILVDDQLKAWLLEVNLSPSLNCDAPIDLKIKSHMICDLLNLVSIPCLDPNKYFDKEKQENHFQSQTNKRSRPHSCVYSSINEMNKSVDNLNSGLSLEHIRILKKVEEENAQCGGFIRIYPVSDTYEFFSNFFEDRKSSLNKIIHQHIYPSRWRKYSINYQDNSKYIRRNNVQRSKYLSSAYHLFNKNNSNEINSSDLQNAIQRYDNYHQRLLNNIYSTKTNIIHPHKIGIEKSVIEFVEEDNSFSLSSSSSEPILVPPQTRRTTPVHYHRTNSSKKNDQQQITNNSNLNDHQTIFFTELNENQFKERSLRVSSAPKRQFKRKSLNDISRLDRSLRPISTIVQHRKQMATRLSRSSNKKLWNEEENDMFNNQESNRDFVEELNELSTKQHRRQYSSSNHLNNFPNESLIIEQQIHIDQKEKEEENKLLQKTSQIIEQNKIKNDQLAKQAKIFQQKLQKNEIYSALNRYSRRPSIYPTSSNKSQQLRNNQRISIFLDQHRIKSSN